MKIKNIHIFDIDGTLIDTTAQAKLMNQRGDVLKTYDFDYFNHHECPQPKPGTYYDFSEFRSLSQLRREPKRKLFQTFIQKYQKDPFSCYILTARKGTQLISDWLVLNQAPLVHTHILTMDAHHVPAHSWKKDKLQEIIRHELSNHEGMYELLQIHIYDDSPRNQKAMASLKNIPSWVHIVIHPV